MIDSDDLEFIQNDLYRFIRRNSNVDTYDLVDRMFYYLAERMDIDTVFTKNSKNSHVAKHVIGAIERSVKNFGHD